ncbi:hypothetical protein C9I56_24270 [Paraburkholderia caribensis]|uniref:Uncharacterized protein n=1 Tax=Paraburkholderia caribensis TaxID=75105 RepID=A0A9Q6WR57_9BURK|nr:hypothetical protein C9I56_24270 [Paraburkholderia caribensis]QLB67306.1 hypothetical protein A9O66_33175 [Paraburkholderia caribensis]
MGNDLPADADVWMAVIHLTTAVGMLPGFEVGSGSPGKFGHQFGRAVGRSVCACTSPITAQKLSSAVTVIKSALLNFVIRSAQHTMSFRDLVPFPDCPRQGTQYLCRCAFLDGLA